MPRRLPRSLRAPKRPPSELQEGPRRPEHFVMEDTAPKSGLEPRREVLVVASAAARFAGLQAEEGLPYQGPVHCPREARIGDREGAASRQEDRFSFQENAQGSRRQERGGGQVLGRQRAPSAQSFCALRASHLCPKRLPRGLRSQAALERKRRRARDPERGARGAPGGRCPKNAQRCDESSFESSSGHRVAKTTSAPPFPRRILSCSAIRAWPGGGIVSALGVLLLNNIIFWIQDGNYPAGVYVENNYPGGIITPN